MLVAEVFDGGNGGAGGTGELGKRVGDLGLLEHKSKMLKREQEGEFSPTTRDSLARSLDPFPSSPFSFFREQLASGFAEQGKATSAGQVS